MSTYEITVYARDDLTFGRDENGNFTVTVAEGAEPETIKIVDDDKGEGGNTFSGSTAAGETGQHAYGELDGEGLDGDAIQPLAALPGGENPDDQIMAIGVGDPVNTIVYGFTFEPIPGETVRFDYDGYDDSPSYNADALYSEGEDNGDTEISVANDTPEHANANKEDDKDKDKDDKDDKDEDHDKDEDDNKDDKDEDDKDEDEEDDKDDDKDEDKDDKDEEHKSSGASGPSGGGSGASGPPCFTRGTAIRTARGEMPVEELVVGDRVWTEGHGMQPVRWICQRVVPATGDFAPVMISAGTLGADRDILVSPAHRMLVQGPEVEVLFGMPKALVAAKDLVNGETITRVTTLQTVEYFHILFDRHEVLQAHGTLSESFFPQANALGSVGAAQRQELFALFPELEFGNGGYSVAYPGLLAHEMALLAV